MDGADGLSESAVAWIPRRITWSFLGSVRPRQGTESPEVDAVASSVHSTLTLAGPRSRQCWAQCRVFSAPTTLR